MDPLPDIFPLFPVNSLLSCFGEEILLRFHQADFEKGGGDCFFIDPQGQHEIIAPDVFRALKVRIQHVFQAGPAHGLLFRGQADVAEGKSLELLVDEIVGLLRQ